MNIRFATKQDITQIVELCKAHALFEETSYSTDNKVEMLSKHLFSSTNSKECIVVENGNELVGYATFMKLFSTWDANFYIYLDCLYLKELARGQNIGEKIMNKKKEYATSKNCNIIQLQTPDFNLRAISFYGKIGATFKTKRTLLLGFK